MEHDARNKSDVDFNALIPELSTWDNGKSVDIDFWLTMVGSYEHAIAYARLFWPAFTIHDGCVLHAGFNKESFRGFMQQTGGNRRAVEAVMNHRHISDLFQNTTHEPSEELIVHLGRVLKEMWSCKLRRDFPERNVLVSFHEENIEDLEDYEITFFQEHESAG